MGRRRPRSRVKRVPDPAENIRPREHPIHRRWWLVVALFVGGSIMTAIYPPSAAAITVLFLVLWAAKII